jgi:hypothetical protein
MIAKVTEEKVALFDTMLAYCAGRVAPLGGPRCFAPMSAGPRRR